MLSLDITDLTCRNRVARLLLEEGELAKEAWTAERCPLDGICWHKPSQKTMRLHRGAIGFLSARPFLLVTVRANYLLGGYTGFRPPDVFRNAPCCLLIGIGNSLVSVRSGS